MDIKRLEIAEINKMIDRIIEMQDLYVNLPEETQERLSNKFKWENNPITLMNDLEIVLRDCLETVKNDISDYIEWAVNSNDFEIMGELRQWEKLI